MDNPTDEQPAEAPEQNYQPAAPVPEYDFDSWSEEKETAVIAALVPDVRHIIVEKRFIGRFLDGTLLELPLTLTLDDIDTLENEANNPVDQIKVLLTKIAGEGETRKFTSHDISEATILATRFFTILQRIQGATVPE